MSDCDSIGDDAFFRYVNLSLPPAERAHGRRQTDESKEQLGPHAVRAGLLGGCDCNCGSTYAQFMLDAVGDEQQVAAAAAAKAALVTAVERIMGQAIATGFLDSNSSVSYLRFALSLLVEPMCVLIVCG